VWDGDDTAPVLFVGGGSLLRRTRLWLVEAASADTSRIKVKMAEAVQKYLQITHFRYARTGCPAHRSRS
jgi:hypothetical protein